MKLGIILAAYWGNVAANCPARNHATGQSLLQRTVVIVNGTEGVAEVEPQAAPLLLEREDSVEDDRLAKLDDAFAKLGDLHGVEESEEDAFRGAVISRVTSVDQLVEEAKLAEQAERYNDMVECMRRVVEQSRGDLTDEQRILLSVAYKNVVDAQLSAWKIVYPIEQELKQQEGSRRRRRRRRGSPPSRQPGVGVRLKAAIAYRNAIGHDLEAECREVIRLIDKRLLKAANSDTEGVDKKVFYEKMKGDYLRYMVEVSLDDREERSEKAYQAYLAATRTAKSLASTHPTKLRLALNYSVFLYEIKKDVRKALEVAKKALDEAIAELHSLKEDCSKESNLILQLLAEKATLWTSELEKKPHCGVGKLRCDHE